MHVTNTIQPLEINGEDSTSVNEERRLLVESHWNYTDRIHLRFLDLELVVLAGDLERAIQNAKNHRR